jgi:hypothetical protein
MIFGVVGIRRVAKCRDLGLGNGSDGRREGFSNSPIQSRDTDRRIVTETTTCSLCEIIRMSCAGEMGDA